MTAQLAAANIDAGVMIDFSHANSLKQHERQMIVGQDVCEQMRQGNRKIMGVMIESHLNAGRQNVVEGEPLKPGVSITDACIGWDDTVNLLDQLSIAVQQRREA